MTRVPSISVIVPAHNAGPYIDSALRSLRNQDYDNLEIVVVDDGSVDATRSIAQSHAKADSRVRVVVLSTASGHPSRARNAGIAAASGDYIAFLDADDIALPGRFSESVKVINATDANVVFGDLERLYPEPRGVETPSVLTQRSFLKCASDYLEVVTVGVYRCRPDFIDFMVTEFEAINILTVVFSRSLIATGETVFDESMLCGEDLDLIYRLAQSGRLAFFDRVCAQYRIHGSSLTRRQRARTVFDGAAVRLRYYEQRAPKLRGHKRAAVRQRIADAFADAGYGFWVEGNPAAARSSILQGMRLAPTWRGGLAYCKTFIRRESRMVEVVRRMAGR